VGVGIDIDNSDFLATIVIITSIVATTEIYGYQIAVAAAEEKNKGTKHILLNLTIHN
jgi:hypothetical protein